MDLSPLIDKLSETHVLSEDEYRLLIDHRSVSSAALLRERAVAVCRKIYGNAVYIRGLIEISNFCRNDCYYCGIRRSNRNCVRYRLKSGEILSCAEAGYRMGFRTVVLQGGEDPYYTDDLLSDLIGQIRESFPDCAVTLSLGERGCSSFQRLFNAGADRYLLRHETADTGLYARLHPASLSLSERMQCLKDLKAIGYQTGCGFMVGAPGQTSRELAEDLKFIEQFHPEMCGIGPFIPHHDTVFANEPAGSAELTCYLLSIIRLILPDVLLPATTALGTIDPRGREKGILSGANVVMPNLSPVNVRKQYELYDNKLISGAESAEQLAALREQMRAIGYEIVTDRGDHRSA